MHLDELRSILLSERETGRLLQIPRDLYQSSEKELDTLLKEVYATEDPFSEKARILIERVSSIRETLHDLFILRAEKILALARTHGEGHYIDREELKRMLPEERDLFDTVVMALGQSRCRLIPAPAAGAGVSRAEAAEEAERCSEVLDNPPVTADYVLSRVLSDMDPFMGVDGRIYHLLQEDIVTLPQRNAEVLCERNIVLNINPGK